MNIVLSQPVIFVFYLSGSVVIEQGRPKVLVRDAFIGFVHHYSKEAIDACL